MGTWIAGAVIFIIAVLAARKIFNDHKSGKGCGGCCEGCSKCPGVSEPDSKENGR